MEQEIDKIVKTEQQWKEILTDEEYRITRKQGTEPPFTGEFYDHYKDGVYTCKCCDLPLFESDTKFKSGTG